jgi:hypothetical protein
MYSLWQYRPASDESDVVRFLESRDSSPMDKKGGETFRVHGEIL